MPVLERDALEASPLADLHAIASEIGMDGYRRLRKALLVDAILQRAGEGPQGVAEAEPEEPEAPAAPVEEATLGAVAESEPAADGGEPEAGEAAGSSAELTRRRRGRRGGRGRGAGREDAAAEAAPEPEPAPAPEPDAQAEAVLELESEPELAAEAEPEPSEALVEGVVELLANGSGFIRSRPGETSDDDVYISATQVKRCDLVSGDRISGPRRAPRRSERFASLVRVDTINGRSATELADSTRYDDLPVAFPSVRFELRAGEDPTLKLIDWLTPIGRGSRVTITGGPRAGKSTLLRALVGALPLGDQEHLLIALAGVRPEEIAQWSDGELKPASATSFAASADAQDQAVELVVDQAKRIAARGAHAIIAIDTLDGLHPQTARKLLAAARAIVGGGSLTLIATASHPLGGETTVISLDARLTSAGHFPALEIATSGTIRPELLVGDEGARAIVQTHADLLRL